MVRKGKAGRILKDGDDVSEDGAADGGNKDAARKKDSSPSAEEVHATTFITSKLAETPCFWLL